MVLNSVTFEYLLSKFQIFKQSAGLLVHEATMDLMLNQRHQNNHGSEPANERQHLKQHNIHSSI
jgi:hypothetical protein